MWTVGANFWLLPSSYGHWMVQQQQICWICAKWENANLHLLAPGQLETHVKPISFCMRFHFLLHHSHLHDLHLGQGFFFYTLHKPQWNMRHVLSISCVLIYVEILSWCYCSLFWKGLSIYHLLFPVYIFQFLGLFG